MVFGATHACPECMLRFARRETCPSCNGAVVSLSDPAGRKALRGARRPRGSSLLFTLGRWAPTRPWMILAIGIAMMLPAAGTLLFWPTMLHDTWLVDDRSREVPHLGTEYRGLSVRGVEILAIGGAGALLCALSIAAWLGHRASAPPASPPQKLRVHALAREPGTDDDVAREITGIAKVATVEIESPLGGEPCLVFGIRGEVDGEEVDDADGGDFDVVTTEGRVIMVSLEHARLEPVGDEEPVELTVDEAVELEPFLVERIGQRVREHCKLAETVIATGDTVTVTGRLAGPALATAPFRDDPRGRILAGDSDHPIVVRVLRRARVPHSRS